MIMKLRYLFGWIFCLTGMNAMAQDFTFSQFYESPLLRNPALAGIMQGNLRLVGAYRSQWGAVTVPYQTQAFSAEVRAPFKMTGDFFTVGMQLTNDMAGDSKLGRVQLMPAFTFHKALNNDMKEVSNYLNVSLMGGYVQSQFDATKLVFNSQYQGGPSPVLNKTNVSYGDLSAGLSFSSNNSGTIKYYVGLAGFHLIRTKVAFYQNDNAILKPRYVLNGGFNMQTGMNDRFYVYGDLMTQGGNRQLLLGFLYKLNLAGYENDDEEVGTKSICFGTSYRWADAFIPTVKLVLGNFFVGTSYDVNVSKLKAASQFRGGLELSAGFISNLNILSVPGQRCPVF